MASSTLSPLGIVTRCCEIAAKRYGQDVDE